MKALQLDSKRIKKYAESKGLGLGELLAEAGVSRTAYYSLVRQESVLPSTIEKIADTLGKPPLSLLSERPESAGAKIRRLRRVADRISKAHPYALWENIWHSLLLLEEPPINRLQRALTRGRRADIIR